MAEKREKERQGPASRKLLRWQDMTLALAVVVACVGFFAFRQQAGLTGYVAKIYLDSQEIREVRLRESDDYRIDLLDEYGVPVSFEVKGGAIRFVDVTCPDHICEKTGFVSIEGQTAVCMPNKAAVVICGSAQ